MIRSLWIARTGLDAQQTSLDVIANNLANTSTNGFKRARRLRRPALSDHPPARCAVVAIDADSERTAVGNGRAADLHGAHPYAGFAADDRE